MGLDLNELRLERTRIESQGQGGGNYLDNFVKMPEGDGVVNVRLLPPRKGGKLYCATRTHRLGADRQAKNFHCLCSLVGDRWQGHCPICTYYKKLWKDSDSAGGDEAKALIAEARSIKPMERFYYNAIVRMLVMPDGSVVKDSGPKILSIGQKLHQRIIRAILGDPTIDEAELGDVTDVATGRDFKIIKKVAKSGADSFPNYDQSKFANSESVAGTEEQIATWLGNLHDLQALRQLKPFEELQKELDIFRGLISEEAPAQHAPPPMPSLPKAAVVREETPAEDESLADDEFIRQLRGAV